MDTTRTVTAQGQLLQLVADQLRSELIWCNGSWWGLRYPYHGYIAWRPFASAELQPTILAVAQELAAFQEPENEDMVDVSLKLARVYRYQAFERQLRSLLAGTELPVTPTQQP
jgi:hypothetical protein